MFGYKILYDDYSTKYFIQIIVRFLHITDTSKIYYERFNL